MQLTIQDGILYALRQQHTIYLEQINYTRIIAHLHTCGYRTTTAQAIAYGILSDRAQTIALAQLVKLLAISAKDDISSIDTL